MVTIIIWLRYFPIFSWLQNPFDLHFFMEARPKRSTYAGVMFSTVIAMHASYIDNN